MLNPATIAVGAGALIGGLVLGWAGRDVVFNTFEKPLLVRSIEQKERDACTIRTLDAAKAAEAKERLHQQQVGRAAIDAFQQASDERERALAAVQDQLEAEIAENEAHVVAEGRSCLLNNDDIARLRGHAG